MRAAVRDEGSAADNYRERADGYRTATTDMAARRTLARAAITGGAFTHKCVVTVIEPSGTARHEAWILQTRIKQQLTS
jgi:hypothetical protein